MNYVINKTGSKWSIFELAELKKNLPNKVIAKNINRTEAAVKKMKTRFNKREYHIIGEK